MEIEEYLLVEEKEYNGGAVKALRVHNYQTVTMPLLVKLFTERGIPETAIIEAECDCLPGDPDRHIEISWNVDDQ